MLKKRLNAAKLSLSIRPYGPILIKSGIETPDPTRPDMEFVRTRHPEAGETVYLPGTSLKGAFRSHSERILAGLGIKEICNPFDRQSACRKASTKRGNKKPDSAEVFREQCPVCQTFGSLSISGRCTFLDAFPWPLGETGSAVLDGALEANRTEKRTQVAIDRITGAARGSALFNLETVTSGTFFTEIVLRNFQLWQIGLLAIVLRDIDEGHQRIGFGKSRGLGSVSVQPDRIEILQVSKNTDSILGVGALCSESDRDRYGFQEEDQTPLPAGGVVEEDWFGNRIKLYGFDQTQAFFETLVSGPLTQMVKRTVRIHSS